jgi:flagellar biosynthesis repressor protein FlbT
MALKITLKPHERVIIGGAVLTNGPSTCHLQVENKVTLLRQENILSEAEATTPCKRIYFVIQLMYISGGITAELSQVYWGLVKEVVKAAPSTNDLVSQISQAIIDDKYYQAMKFAKKLIRYEEELVRNATELA